MVIARNSLLLGIAIGVAGTLAVSQIAGMASHQKPAASASTQLPPTTSPGASPANRDDEAEFSSSLEIEGEQYRLGKQADGAVLTSTTGKKIVLGRDCVVHSDVLGTGRWEWAEFALILMWHNREHTFPSREPPVPNTSCRWQGNW